ncbi:hypothetical protein DFJ77DRAFT_456986 [Powellomyces hirtus]|nr:hypothetical protein DFJ77DRAFT_456986 [Powellomyces hirtus]
MLRLIIVASVFLGFVLVSSISWRVSLIGSVFLRARLIIVSAVLQRVLLVIVGSVFLRVFLTSSVGRRVSFVGAIFFRFIQILSVLMRIILARIVILPDVVVVLLMVILVFSSRVCLFWLILWGGVDISSGTRSAAGTTSCMRCVLGGPWLKPRSRRSPIMKMPRSYYSEWVRRWQRVRAPVRCIIVQDTES